MHDTRRGNHRLPVPKLRPSAVEADRDHDYINLPIKSPSVNGLHGLAVCDVHRS